MLLRGSWEYDPAEMMVNSIDPLNLIQIMLAEGSE